MFREIAKGIGYDLALVAGDRPRNVKSSIIRNFNGLIAHHQNRAVIGRCW